MPATLSLSSTDEAEYTLIEATVTETARGRWFLDEYARRHRGADTDTLLQAIARLESAVTSERGTDDIARLRGDLMEMAEAIARTKAEIGATTNPGQDHSHLSVASEALDAIVRATERATSDILGAAEDVQEAAWTLRESGIDSALCDELDRRATEIYTACSFQDLTAQRTSRVVHTLRYLEERIASTIRILGGNLDEIQAAPGPAALPAQDESPELCQSDVDRFLDQDAQAEAATTPGDEPVEADLAEEDVAAETGDIEFSPLGEAAAPIVADLPEADIFEESIIREPKAEPAEPPMPLAATLSLEDDLVFVPTPPVAQPDPKRRKSASAKTPAASLASAFGDLDSLSIEEKMALFS